MILIAAKDADDDANFLKSDTERVELGKLKGNEGDQNYEIPRRHGPEQIPNSLDLLRAIQRKFRRRTSREVLTLRFISTRIGQPETARFHLRKGANHDGGAGSWLLRKKWILAGVGVPVLIRGLVGFSSRETVDQPAGQ